MESEVLTIPKLNSLIYNSGLGGSTNAKLYKNSKNNKWVVKGSKNPDQCLVEYRANSIYEALGIHVPRHEYDPVNNVLILEYIDGKLLGDIHDMKEKEEIYKIISENFVVDALLANWDVIGLYQDNIIVPNDGTDPVRIDNGGTFNFKATGGQKKFDKTVDELKNMRDYKKSPEGFKVFGKLTYEDIYKQIKILIEPNYSKILSLTDESLKPVMMERMNYLLDILVWTNATKFKNTVEETAVPEYINDVRKGLLEIFRDGWKKINERGDDNELIMYLDKLLKENNAVVSGGFILKAIGAFKDDKSVDIDIYVPTAYADKFKKEMSKLFDYKSVINHVVSDTPESFFKKNGILSVSKYSKEKPKYTEMDIVEVNEDRMPIDVVKNFDLTFCENWYDGKMVYMTYPDHVKYKEGFLENHYLNLYKDVNKVLINRMKKYINRGFKISINHPLKKEKVNVTSNVLVLANSLGANNNKKKNWRSHISHGNFNDIDDSIKNSIKTSINENTRRSKNIKLYVNTDVYSSLDNIFKMNIDILSPVEKNIIKDYTGNGSSVINKYLYSNNKINYNSVILRFFKNMYKINEGENIETYNNRLLYYYYVNLYNGLQKGIVVDLEKFFVLYRGTLTGYLSEDMDNFYYMNSFVSSSININVAKNFSSSLIYRFIVHPLCKYMDVSPISYYNRESEILMTPYHRYVLLNKEDNMNTYLILPCDLRIPNDFNEFMEWKEKVNTINNDIILLRNDIKKLKTIHYGGEKSIFNIFKTSNNRQNKLNSKTKNINVRKTIRINTRKIYEELYKERMICKVPSFKGNKISDNEKILIEKLRKTLI